MIIQDKFYQGLMQHEALTLVMGSLQMFGVMHLMFCDLIDIFREKL